MCSVQIHQHVISNYQLIMYIPTVYIYLYNHSIDGYLTSGHAWPNEAMWMDGRRWRILPSCISVYRGHTDQDTDHAMLFTIWELEWDCNFTMRSRGIHNSALQAMLSFTRYAIGRPYRAGGHAVSANAHNPLSHGLVGQQHGLKVNCQ